MLPDATKVRLDEQVNAWAWNVLTMIFKNESEVVLVLFIDFYLSSCAFFHLRFLDFFLPKLFWKIVI